MKDNVHKSTGKTEINKKLVQLGEAVQIKHTKETQILHRGNSTLHAST
jgi:hypothetical protein